MSMNPVTVLVVDDELPIREELRAFPWESCGAELIGEAGNGEEALMKCEPYPPDIIVSDIAMPTMDGLALMAEVRRRYPGVQVILLTCHSDFQYAKEAIRLGALEYILKVSLDEEELKDAIKKAKEALLRERGHRRHETRLLRAKTAKRLEALVEKFRAAPRSSVPEIGPDDWERLGIGQSFPYRFVRLWLSVPPDASWIVQDAVHSVLIDYEQRNASCAAWFPIGADEAAIWFANCESADRLIPDAERLLGDIRSAVAATSLVDERDAALHAVVGDAVRSRADALAALAATSEWKETAFYLQDPSPSLRIGMPPPLRELTEEHRKFLHAALRQAGWDAERLVRFASNDFPAWCIEQRIRPLPLKRLLAQWASERLSELGAANEAYERVSSLLAAADLKSLTDAFVRLVRSTTVTEEHVRPEIKDAKRWIQDRLQEPLTLTLVAERAGLRPEYFSRLFKDETGESVNQYITRLRMEKALELLKHSQLKVYEVAEAVGIPNYRYFTSMFRNWAGAAPTEVKRGLRHGERE